MIRVRGVIRSERYIVGYTVIVHSWLYSDKLDKHPELYD